jgi:hypothetical protein
MFLEEYFFAQYLAMEQPCRCDQIEDKNPIGEDQELAQQQDAFQIEKTPCLDSILFKVC